MAKKVASKKKIAVKKTPIKKNIKTSKTSPKLVKKSEIQSQVSEGSRVPNFSAPLTGNQVFELKKYLGSKVVLYFYPRDATPGCTIQGHEFTKLNAEFKKLGVFVFGISRDSMKSHEKFKTKECYTIDLISDEDEKICQIFGVIKEKNMYGKKVFGIERSTFVVDEKGVLIKEWRKVQAEGQAQQTLEFFKSLKD